MARQKKPDRFICIEDRGTGALRWRVHFVRAGKRMAVGVGSAEEAEALERRVRAATAHLQTATVAQALEEYFVDMVERKKWRRTAKTYTSKVGLVKRFLAPVADLPVGAVTGPHIDRCCKAWDGPTRTAPETRRLGRVRAKAFFAWAVRARMLKTSPMGEQHDMPKDKGQRPRLRMDEARVLRTVLDEAAAHGDQTAIFVLTALVLGARTSEVQTLTRRNFDDGGRVVTYQDAKDPEKWHRVRMPEVLHEPLRHLAAAVGDDTLFPSRGWRANTWGACAVRHWARAAGLEMAEEMDVRWLRRTNNTLAVEAGVSAEVVARETGRSLHVVRKHYVARGAETTASAAAMDEATRESGTTKNPNGTGARKVAK